MSALPGEAAGFHRCPRRSTAIAASNALAALLAASALTLSLIVAFAIVSLDVLNGATAGLLS